MITEVIKHEVENPRHHIVLLHGRGMNAESMIKIYLKSVTDCNLYSFGAEGNMWYEIPYDTATFSKSMEESRVDIEKHIKELNIDNKDLIISGFSAGGVMAIQLVAQLRGYKGAIVHSGALPNKYELPFAKGQVPVVLTHSKDDDAFTWKQRFVPMQETLFRNGYDVRPMTREDAGHKIFAINEAIKTFEDFDGTYNILVS